MHFFADSRDLTGCRYYVVGHCCRGSRFVHRFYPLLPTAEIRPPSSPSPLSHNIARSPIRSDPIRRSYIYCIEETRAAAFHAHAPPVMSGLQSCLSFRPSIQRTGRPVALHAPYLVPSREISSPPSLPLFPSLLPRPPFSTAPARYSSLAWLPRYLISPLSTGTVRLHPDTYAPNCTFLARFI